MFKRKKKKTGLQTPEYRKPTPPPPPPTSGSNAVKPNPNYTPPASVPKPMPAVYSMKFGDLDNWVKTKAQIGDVAYCYDRILDCHYIYCYRKPDDNPAWMMIQPAFLTDYLQKAKEQEHKMEYKIDIDAMIKERLDNIVGKSCPYKTPCGWCAKWDKKCDKKIGGNNDIKSRREKDTTLEYIKSGKGLPPLNTNSAHGIWRTNDDNTI